MIQKYQIIMSTLKETQIQNNHTIEHLYNKLLICNRCLFISHAINGAIISADTSLCHIGTAFAVVVACCGCGVFSNIYCIQSMQQCQALTLSSMLTKLIYFLF